MQTMTIKRCIASRFDTSYGKSLGRSRILSRIHEIACMQGVFRPVTVLDKMFSEYSSPNYLQRCLKAFWLNVFAEDTDI